MQYSLYNISQAAQFILQNIGNTKVVCFEATMGSGKTTLIAEICRQLSVIDVPSSPTYSIINEYTTKDNKSIYHLDLYRIKDEEEAIQAGVEEVLYTGDLCFIEWPQVIENFLPKDALFFKMHILDDTKREIVLLKK